MIYFLALLPATALTVAGYIVLFLATRAEGALRTFGRYLGFWAFTLAGLVILGAIFAAAHGGHRGHFWKHDHELHCPWPEKEGAGAFRGPPLPAAPPVQGSGTAPPAIP